MPPKEISLKTENVYELCNTTPTSRPRWTTAQKKEIINRHPFCSYCEEGDYRQLVIDHIYPITLGGSNNLNNLTIACIKCNSHKWSYTVESFLETIINKRNYVVNKTYSYIYWLRKLRSGNSKHYMHTENVLIRKIILNRLQHSYFSRIINSINEKKYKIF